MVNLFIVSNLQFENLQGAAFTRLLNYSKALKGNFTIYLTTHNSGISVECLQKLDITENFILITNKNKKPRTKVYKLIFRHFDFIGSYKYLKCIHHYFKSNGMDMDRILFYGTDLALAINSLLYFKKTERKEVFIEKSELEIGIVLNQYIPLNFKGFLVILILPFQFVCSLILDLIAPFFSGIIVISRRMEKLYSRYSNKILHVPILTNIPGTNYCLSEYAYEHFLIGYTGAVSIKKDGIFEFINALGLLTEIYKKSIRLNIFGDGNKEEVEKLNKLIRNYHLGNVVTFQQMVPAQDVPELLCKHDLLILTRSSNIQTEYGFSTKLAEYLAAGIPVLTTKVSDNSIYLKDGENALLVEPGDINAIVSKLQYAFDNRSHIRNIGIAGRKTAEKHFYYGLYSEPLKKFFTE